MVKLQSELQALETCNSDGISVDLTNHCYTDYHQLTQSNTAGNLYESLVTEIYLNSFNISDLILVIIQWIITNSLLNMKYARRVF
jgi:hypothetical protein